ncbi:DMT family transporter [Streptomyces sp. NPDC097619]|uniref:DMT family transporter n=1 Tax=Streptomyces sp. NPDC097619 TaxID=3157228 RepID=UPI0033319BEC
MRAHDSATPQSRIAVPQPGTHGAPAGTAPTHTAPTVAAPTPGPPTPGEASVASGSSRRGTACAALGVAAFSLTFPSTAWGLESFGPWSLVSLRALLGAVVAGALLLALRVPVPARAHWAGLAVVTAGVVLGFPALTTLALRSTGTSHAAVVVGLLPLTTAAFAALRTGSRPSRRFWVAAVAGACVLLGFTLAQGGGVLSPGDGYLFLALLVCAAAYVEGGRLARLMPGWQVMGWALLLSVPLALPGAVLALSLEPTSLGPRGLTGLVWVALGSTFFGGYVWYRGIAEIGPARAGQLQLAQPLLTLVWAVTLLGEHLSPAAPVAAAAVLVCIAVTQRG